MNDDGSDTNRARSRRQFLAGCGAIGAAAVTPAIGHAAPNQPAALAEGDPDLRGVSPEGRREIAAFDRRFAQQRGGTANTVHAVKDLGLDPSGGTPINGKFEGAIESLPSNTRVIFPGDGTFRVTKRMVVRPSGPIDLIGNGCTFKLDSDMERSILNIDKFPSGSLLKGFNFASTGDTAFGVRVATEGTVKVKNINIKGYMVSDQSNPQRVQGVFAPVAYTESAAVRATNVTAIGGTAAGTHDQPDKPASATVNQIASPMGVWVGQSTQGTVQLVKCQFRGWSNAVYGGHTQGRVGVYGGEYWNNINSQQRLGGGSVIDGATLVLDDRKWSMKQNPGPFSLGKNQGVYAVRVDPGDSGNKSDPLRIKNTEIRALSMQEGASVIDVEPDAGPCIIENTKIINHLDRPVIYGAPPNSGISRGNIMVKHSLVGGKSPRPAMEINDRPQSRITTTCITIPDAGPDDIQGADIGKGVSFGKCTAGSGLSAPKTVGSPGKISSLPAPTYNGSAPGSVSSGPSQAAKNAFAKTALGAAALIVLVVIGVMVGLPVIAIALGGLSSLLLAYILDGD
jgi:hypothetical protein